jgi:hypothetical protein
MQALRIHTGPRVRRHLRERGLAAADVRVIRQPPVDRRGWC